MKMDYEIKVTINKEEFDELDAIRKKIILQKELDDRKYALDLREHKLDEVFLETKNMLKENREILNELNSNCIVKEITNVYDRNFGFNSDASSVKFRLAQSFDYKDLQSLKNDLSYEKRELERMNVFQFIKWKFTK